MLVGFPLKNHPFWSTSNLGNPQIMICHSENVGFEDMPLPMRPYVRGCRVVESYPYPIEVFQSIGNVILPTIMPENLESLGIIFPCLTQEKTKNRCGHQKPNVGCTLWSSSMAKENPQFNGCTVEI